MFQVAWLAMIHVGVKGEITERGRWWPGKSSLLSCSALPFALHNFLFFYLYWAKETVTNWRWRFLVHQFVYVLFLPFLFSFFFFVINVISFIIYYSFSLFFFLGVTFYHRVKAIMETQIQDSGSEQINVVGHLYSLPKLTFATYSFDKIKMALEFKWFICLRTSTSRPFTYHFVLLCGS